MALYNIGSSGNDVSNIQQQLLNAGFDPQGIDGIYGKNTAAAVRAFQQAAGITVDGIYGPQTAAAMANWKPASAQQLPASGIQPTASTGLIPLNNPDDSLQTPQFNYTSPFGQQMQDAFKQWQQFISTPFQYNPNTDPSFQQASKNLQNKIMLDFARRNMLYSPATGQAVGEGIAEAMPQFEQAAYNRHMQQGQNMFNVFSALMSLDDNEFRKYQTSIENDWREFEASRNAKLDALDQQYKRIDYAFKKLDEMQVADNEVASILGIPVGTKSQAAKQRAEDYKFQIEQQKRQENAAYQRMLKDHELQKEYFDYTEKVKSESLIPNKGTPQQQLNYKNIYNLMLQQSGGDANLALQSFLSDPEYANSDQIGPELYKIMVENLKTLAASQTKSLSSGQTLSYQDRYKNYVSQINRDYYSIDPITKTKVKDTEAIIKFLEELQERGEDPQLLTDLASIYNISVEAQ